MMLKGLTELRNGKPELCNARLNFELRKMKCTFSFFENIKGNIDAFSRSVDKSISIFKKSVPFFEKHKDISELVQNLNNVMRIIAGVSLSMQEQLTNLFGPFLQHYENTSREMIQKLSKIVDDTSSKANKLFKVQEKYKEKMAKYSQNEENKSKAKAFDDAKTDYVQQIQIYNQVVDQNQALFKEKLDLLLQQEDYREDMIQKLYNGFTSTFEEAGKSIAALFSSTEEPAPIKLFSEEIKIDFFPKIEINDIPVVGLPPTPAQPKKEIISEEEKSLLITVVNDLIKGKVPESGVKSTIIDLMETEEGRIVLGEELLSVSKKCNINNIAALKILGEIMNYALTALSLYNDQNANLLNAYFHISTHLYSTDIKKSKYLRDFISTNGIWKRKERWYMIIACLVKRVEKKLQSFYKTKEPTTIEKQKIQRRAMIFSELTSIAVEMSLFGVPLEVGREILISKGTEFEVGDENLFQLLTEFESSQPLEIDTNPSAKDLMIVSLSKRDKERRKYGYSKLCMVIGLSIGFVNDKKTLSNILLVNHECYSVFKMKIYKAVIKGLEIEGKFPIWKNILVSQDIMNLYPKLKGAAVEDFKLHNKQISEVIRMDVIRSFHAHKPEIQEKIMNILRCYAVFNSEVEYCQGMNFIAGLFFLLSNNEEMSFSMFTNMIANLDLTYMFKQGVPMLKMYCYQLNRLIGIYFPELHAHLFEEGINSTYFCSPWFLTAFSYVLQSRRSTDLPVLLFDIFDLLLTSGLKAIFKTGLFILGHFEEQFLTMRYEQIVQILSELPKTDFFDNPAIRSKYKKEIKRFNISEELIEKLNDEYSSITLMIQESKPSGKRNPYRHFNRYERVIMMIVF